MVIRLGRGGRIYIWLGFLSGKEGHGWSVNISRSPRQTSVRKEPRHLHSSPEQGCALSPLSAAGRHLAAAGSYRRVQNNLAPARIGFPSCLRFSFLLVVWPQTVLTLNTNGRTVTIFLSFRPNKKPAVPIAYSTITVQTLSAHFAKNDDFFSPSNGTGN